MKFKLIVAVCENLGMGNKGEIPWKLKGELRHFNRLTRKVSDVSKRNVVIMGRKTFMSIPEKNRPLPHRINLVLTRNPSASDYAEGVLLCSSLESAMKRVETELKDVENVWIIGGYESFKEALASPRLDRLYLTEIHAKFECDTFFPELPSDLVEVPLEDGIPQGVQEEEGVKYVYKIYERRLAHK